MNFTSFSHDICVSRAKFDSKADFEVRLPLARQKPNKKIYCKYKMEIGRFSSPKTTIIVAILPRDILAA